MHLGKKLVLVLSLLLFVFIPNFIFADVTPKVKSLGIDAPKQVLFIGNSYLYYGDSLHNHVVRMAKAADKENANLYKYKFLCTFYYSIQCAITITGYTCHYGNSFSA